MTGTHSYQKQLMSRVHCWHKKAIKAETNLRHGYVRQLAKEETSYGVYLGELWKRTVS